MILTAIRRQIFRGEMLLYFENLNVIKTSHFFPPLDIASRHLQNKYVITISITSRFEKGSSLQPLSVLVIFYRPQIFI